MNYQSVVTFDPYLKDAWFTDSDTMPTAAQGKCFSGVYTVAGAPANVPGAYIGGAVVYNAADSTVYTNAGTIGSPNFVAFGGGSVLKATVTVSAADLKAVVTGPTPFQLIDAPGSGKYLNVLNVSSSIAYATTPYDFDDNLALSTGSGPFLSFGVASSFLDASADSAAQCNASTEGSAISINSPLSIYKGRARTVTTGDSPVTFTIYYTVI